MVDNARFERERVREQAMEGRLRLAQIGYNEVLDATKHNDDKIGRSLTSIAFFTTAGVAFAVGNSEQALYVRYRMGGATVPLPSIFLLTFFVIIVLTVIMYLSAMGNPLTLPSQKKNPQDRKKDDSNLFFFVIARQELDDWKKNWGFDGEVKYDDIRLRAINNFLSETHNLARRVKFKYERMEIARALLITALISLAFAFVSAIIPFLNHSTSISGFHIVSWSTLSRIYFGATIALIELCLILEAFNNSVFRQKSKPGTEEKANLHLRILGLLPVFSITLLMVNARNSASLVNCILIIVATVAGCSVVKIVKTVYYFQPRTSDKTKPGEVRQSSNSDCGSETRNGTGDKQKSYLGWRSALCVIALVAVIPIILLSIEWAEACDLLLLSLAISPILITLFNSVKETFDN